MGERMTPGECLFSGGHLWETVPGSRCLRCDRPANRSLTAAGRALLDDLSLLEYTAGEWADRCRRLIATLDAERASARRAALSEAAEAVRGLASQEWESPDPKAPGSGIALLVDRAAVLALLDRLAEPAP